MLRVARCRIWAKLRVAPLISEGNRPVKLKIVPNKPRPVAFESLFCVLLEFITATPFPVKTIAISNRREHPGGGNAARLRKVTNNNGTKFRLD